MLLIDRRLEGLMPVLAEGLPTRFVRLESEGTTILLAEQDVELARPAPIAAPSWTSA